MAKVSGLGHVGIYVSDMAKMLTFYTDVLGLAVTDRAANNVVFLSARSEEEHHEIVLIHSVEEETDVGQVSFQAESLDGLRDLYGKVCQSGREADVVVTRMALSFYFLDPEDNNVEVYWPAAIDCTQPFVEPIDLHGSTGDLMKWLESVKPRESAGRPD